MAARVQRRRIAGWRAPSGAVYVGRPTRWGNPWTVVRDGCLVQVAAPDGGLQVADDVADARARAAAEYGRWLQDPEQAGLRAVARRELAGRDLMCWCPPDQRCHADLLLEVANTPRERERR
jgi:hypothetical protein